MICINLRAQETGTQGGMPRNLGNRVTGWHGEMRLAESQGGCSFGVCVSMESGPWPSQHHKQTKPRAERGARKCNEGEEREGTAQMDGKSG